MVVACSLCDELVKKMSNPSSQGIGKFRSTCQDLYSLGKQAWYVPFIWSLAWFSYWTFHDALVLKQITQGTPSALLGLSISISALLFGGYVSGKPVTRRVAEKANGFVGMLKRKFLFRGSFEDSLGAPVPPQEIHQEVSSRSSLNPEVGRDEPNETGLGEISSDCLVCPNLLGCNERLDRRGESVTRCPLTK